MRTKTIKVIFVGDAKKEFNDLNKIVGDELSRGIKGSDKQTLLKSIKQKSELLKSNPQYGVHIPKNKIPKEYKEKYDANNLWKVNLSGYWRMIYMIRGTKVEVIALILDIVDHKKYNKLFGYRKK